MADLLVIVPSRGRPESLERVAAAWYATGAFADGAALVFAVDDDDPTWSGYRAALDRLAEADPGPTAINLMHAGAWRPMVAKLNAAAANFAGQGHFALAFAGDDHLPRTPGWAKRYLDELRTLGTGIVYGDDLVQGARLPTQWAMTADIVRALGRMVPAPVEHLYCDNAILDLGQAAECIRYLPDVVIEHCHPIAGRGQWDDQYRRVNARAQYERDGSAYWRWRTAGLPTDAVTVQALRATRPLIIDSGPVLLSAVSGPLAQEGAHGGDRAGAGQPDPRHDPGHVDADAVHRSGEGAADDDRADGDGGRH